MVLGGAILLMVSRMSLWHPMTAYLLFHFYSFSWRLTLIINGSPLMYTGQDKAEPIRIDEIERAMFWADIGLITFAIFSWLAHRYFESKAHEPVIRRVMNQKVVKMVGLICIPVGFFMFFGVKNHLIDFDYGSAASGYILTAASWPMGALAVLIFSFGFRRELVLLSILYLSNVALQGRNRFMFVLPLFFLAAFYVQKMRRRWPSVTILIAGAIVALLFPRLKYIGTAIQTGDTAEATSQVLQSFNIGPDGGQTIQGENFLDQFAGALTLTDYSGIRLGGRTYLAVITLPVPRAWWPGKPGLADHVKEISTPGRQYDVDGRIITYLGEAYINFGYAGFFLVPALSGYLLTLICLRATTGPMLRLSRYLYLVLFTSFVQAFRDGLASLMLFTFVHNMPMLFTWALHLFPGNSMKVLDRPPADPLAGDEEEDIRRRTHGLTTPE